VAYRLFSSPGNAIKPAHCCWEDALAGQTVFAAFSSQAHKGAGNVKRAQFPICTHDAPAASSKKTAVFNRCSEQDVRASGFAWLPASRSSCVGHKGARILTEINRLPELRLEMPAAFPGSYRGASTERPANLTDSPFVLLDI
jgi:hypothetical protein